MEKLKMIKLKGLILQKYIQNRQYVNKNVEKYFYSKLNSLNCMKSNIWKDMQPILNVQYDCSPNPNTLSVVVQIDDIPTLQLVYKVKIMPGDKRIKLVSSMDPLKSPFIRNNSYGNYPYKMFKSNNILKILRSQIQDVNNLKRFISFYQGL